MTDLLVTKQRCIERIVSNWSQFCDLRIQHLSQATRFGVAPEKIAEQIIGELFTVVLDWPITSLNYQVEHSDIIITSPGVKWIVIEAKRPGLLTSGGNQLNQAFDQVLRYASEQKVKCVTVSDGNILVAKDVQFGGLKDRIYVDLRSVGAPKALWWLSQHGIYRNCEEPSSMDSIVTTDKTNDTLDSADIGLIHPKYKVPSNCFAYVGNYGDVKTWKLPYLKIDGTVDTKRLPLAISSIVKTYRGERVKSIPEPAIPEVLIRLAKAANQLGKLPNRLPDNPITNYELLYMAIYQQGKLNEVF